jgi:transposase
MECLKTSPGIGDILALTIVLETGDIGRFKGPGNYASYCRCVDSRRESNGKKKGENNRKNGNRYLAWAFIEAANFAIRRSESAKRYYQKKAQQTNEIVARKALAHKLARACYWMMKKRVSFEETLIFG